MASITYTSRCSLPITYQWRCSNCGTTNRVSTTIKSKSEDVSYGKKYDAKRASSASFGAQLGMRFALKAMGGERGSIDQYRMLGLNHACKRCGHKEPWAVKNRVELRDAILKVGTFIFCWVVIAFLIFFIELIQGKQSYAVFVWFGIAVLMVSGYYINKGWNKNYIVKKEREIKQCSISSLPILVIDDEPIVDVDLLERIDAEKNEKTTEELTKECSAPHNEKTQLTETEDNKAIAFCRKCGEKIPADSVFCPKCGEKVIKI